MSEVMNDNVEATCVFCGRKFMSSKRSAMYCSGICKHRAREARLGKLRGDVVCPNCGKVFQPKTSKQNFCSRSCSTTYSHAHCWSEKKRICVDCGAEFLSQRKDRKRCVACWNKYRSQMTMMYRYAKDPTIQIGVGSGGAQTPLVSQLDDETRDKLNAARRERYRQRKMSGEATRNYRKILTGHDSCMFCGYHRSQDAIVVHHLDMDRTHNNPDNLLILCRNCHARLHAIIRRILRQDKSSNISEISEWIKNHFKAEVKQRKKIWDELYEPIRPEG